MTCSLAAEKSNLPEGKIETPYEACKNILIVSEKKYQESKTNWDLIEKKCNMKIQFANDIELTSINPLKEGVQYLSFSVKVVEKVIETLQKNRRYVDCSSSCFQGRITCPASENEKVVQCSERKKEIQEGMKVLSRKIKMELALSDDAPGLLNLNIRNVLSVDKSKFINTNLRDFEIGMPNPVGRIDLSERELKEAYRRSVADRKALEDEYKAKGYNNYSDWMSVKLMEKFDEHRARYRGLIYEEAPIFSVIERPVKMEKGDDPFWSDAQVAKAFLKLSENIKMTEEKVNKSLKNSTLEFKRITGEALKNFLTADKDLLYYIGMKNQVEEVLKNDPAFCAIATSMEARLHTKELQNAGITMAATLASAHVGGALLRIGMAVTAAEATGITGMALGGAFIADSFRQYNVTTIEAATISGLGADKEGKAIRKAEEITQTHDGLKMSLMFAPIGTTGGWSVGKILYSSLSKQMQKDLPEMAILMKNAKLDTVSRDQAVDKWLFMKVKSAVKTGGIDEVDQQALQSDKAKNVLESLTAEIEKANPDFFKNPKNMDFFLKTAATTVKSEIGDPADLGEKAKLLLLHFNTEAMNGSWDPKGQNALLKVFDRAILELRLSAKNDPATYAKFSTDPEAQQKIVQNALRRSGAKEEEIKAMSQCALSK